MSHALATFRDLVKVHGSTHTYVRGEQSVSLSAVPGRREYRVLDADGVLTTFSSHDRVVAAEDLVIDDTRLTPQRGDVIQQTVDGQVHTFHVQFPDPNQPPYRWSDDVGRVLVIHTVFAGTAPAE